MCQSNAKDLMQPNSNGMKRSEYSIQCQSAHNMISTTPYEEALFKYKVLNTYISWLLKEFCTGKKSMPGNSLVAWVKSRVREKAW